MRLELYMADLREGSREKPTSSIGFKDLTEQAQQAVIAVGRGTFYRDRGAPTENYNTIYAPQG